MTFPISIAYQGLPPSPILNAHIEHLVLQLQKYAPALQSCRVHVRRAGRRHSKANRFFVTVHASLPGADVHAHSGDADQAHADVFVAASNAIQALRGQLEDIERIRHDGVRALR